MSKVIKILVSLLSYLILGTIMISIAVVLILQINVVQNYVVDKLTDLISQKLETDISIGSVSLGLNGRLTIDDLYLEDMQGDTLINAGTLKVSVSYWNLIKSGEVSLDEVYLSDVKFNLIQREVGMSNLKQILNRLKSDKPKKKSLFKITVQDVEVDNLNFIHKKLNIPRRDYGINFNDIQINNFRLKAQDISVIGDSISMKVNNIALNEKSGFQLNSLSSSLLNISSKGISLDDLVVKSKYSNIKLTYLRLSSDSWEEYSDFLNKVVLDGKSVGSKIAFSTVSYFAPTLKKWESVLYNVDLSLYGTIADLKGRVENASIMNTDVKATYRIKGLPDIENTRFELTLDNLESSAKDVKLIMEDITEKAFTVLDKFEKKLDDIKLKGRFNGKLTNFLSDLELITRYGVVDVNARLTPDRSSTYKFDSNLDINRFNLGGFFGSKTIGLMSITGSFKGRIGAKKIMDIKTDAKIEALQYNGYNYSNIDMVGTLNDNMFVGSLSSDDPNIDFSFDGALDFSNDIPKYDFDFNLRNIDLSRLNINKVDSISMLSCEVVANASGTDLDDINGNIKVTDLTYINQIDTITTQSIELIGENSETSKYLALNSNFADVEFRSKTSYRDLFDYMKAVLNTYLPTLKTKKYGNYNSDIDGDVTSIDNYSLLKIDVKEASNLVAVLVPGLYVSEGTKSSLLLNSKAQTVAISVKSEYIEYNDILVSKLDVNTRNVGDSLVLYVGAKELYAGAVYMPNFSIIGGAKDNIVNLAAKFNNIESGRSALIGCDAFVERNSDTHIPQLRVKFTPSYMKIKDQTWRIDSKDIVYDTTGISIGEFSIINKEQKLIFNGVASERETDTLAVRLSEFNVAPISQFTEKLGYDMKGLLSGDAYAVSILKGGLIGADILFDSLAINDIELPTVKLKSDWDTKLGCVNVALLRSDNQDSIINGYYYPKDKTYQADVKMKGVHISLLDPLLKGVMRSTNGEADVDVVLSGSGNKLDMNGGIALSKFSTLIDFTNVRYAVDSAYIDVKNSKLKLRTATVLDPKGNKADLNLDLDLQNFGNIKYNVKIFPENLLVLNTSMTQSSMFYGSVYASGVATIKGDKGGVDMDISASTAGNSEFYLPLSGKSNASTASFIIFEDSKKVQKTSYTTLERKKLMMENRGRSRAKNATNMNINLALNVLSNTELQVLIDPTVGDAIKARGNGMLNLAINPTKNIFSMIGDYEITSGSYLFTLQNIINKQFTIEPGSTIKWTGDPINALLDITALYKLKTSLAPLDPERTGYVPVECKIFLKDRLSQPNVSFGVTIPGAEPEVQSLVSHLLNTQEMVSTQFFWLLAINSFYTDSGLGGGGIGAGAGSATGFEFLTSQISNWISSDKFNVGIRYKPKDEMSSDEVNVDFSTHLFSNRLLLEVEGNYDTGNNHSLSESTTDIRGDFYLTWLIDKSDNLRAKVFSRTIDSFDETDGLQESGIGIYYKDSFNVFRDVIESIRKHFSYKERKRRQIIRIENRKKRKEEKNREFISK